MTTVELREKRATLLAEARKAWDDAQKRDGGPTAEDVQAFDRLMSEAARIKDQYERSEALEAAEVELERPEPARGAAISSRDRTPGESRADARKAEQRYLEGEEYQSIYNHWLRTGEIRSGRIPAEFRDTILGTDAKGGFLVTPVRLANQIVKVVDDTTFIMGLATTVPVDDAKSLGIPQLSTRMADANWTTEVAAVTEDTTMALGRLDLTPQMLTKLSKVSLRLLNVMAGIEQFISTELGYKFAITLEKGFLSGNGTAPNPLGVFTASASGIPTGRDVSTGNTTTAIGADNLFEVKYSLKDPYLRDPSCRWMFHRDAIKSIAKLKDTTNQYLWQPGLATGQPDTLLGIPVLQSEYVPNTFTTGLYVGILGAFRYYWVAYVGSPGMPEVSIQRLVELYSGTNEVGFIGRMMVAGGPALGEAFARVKLA